MRAILDAAVAPPDRVRLGSLLAEIGRDAGGVDLDVERDATVTAPVDLHVIGFAVATRDTGPFVPAEVPVLDPLKSPAHHAIGA